MTALMFAVKKDKLEVAKVLVGSGANINIQEHVCVTNQHKCIVYSVSFMLLF